MTIRAKCTNRFYRAAARLAACCVIVIGLAAARAVEAEPRLALVIGNGSYSAVTPLDNPVTDAELLAQSLEDVGFEVTLLTDADLPALSRGIAQFGRALRQAGPEATGLFYFAGHGVQSFGANYLLPVDAELGNAADLDFVAVEAQSVLRQMFSARNRTNIVILDACRNNPFEAMPEFGETGLAEMKAPTGTFLAYATAPGEVAYDGEGENSPFTAALARQMQVPGRTIEDVFREVRVDVLRTTQGLQTPWDTSSLTAEFRFVQTEPEDPADLAAEQLWSGVRESNDPLQIMLYLRGYPNSPYATEARGILSGLLSTELGTETAAAPAPAVEEPSAREQEMIEQAQASGDLGDYEAYLAEFPSGVFAEFARSEIETNRAQDPDAGEEIAALPQGSAGGGTVQSPGGIDLPSEVFFNQPLVSASPELNGRA
ncbi:MAG: caspase family protein, partial [Pseudomonadota bacterium]